jgi:hypothetical protein
MSKAKQWATFVIMNAVEIALIYQMYLGTGWAINVIVFWGIFQCLFTIIATISIAVAPHIADLSDTSIAANVKMVKALKSPIAVPSSFSLFVNSAILLTFIAMGYWGLTALRLTTMLAKGLMEAMGNTILDRLKKGDNHE